MNYVILGGAGFIGSNLATKLVGEGEQVLCIDSLVNGTESRIDHLRKLPNFEYHNLDIRKTELLTKVIPPGSIVIHLASNPDIAAAVNNPRIDFTDGTLITESALEASRLAKISRFVYASGSGVYRENYVDTLDENAQLLPISTYGASKLAGEALAASYSFMFGIHVSVFRFANVVGPRQTHGVCYDFLRRLRLDLNKLEVRGNGEQRKSYVHVSDVISGILTAVGRKCEGYEVFNVATLDSITVREIVGLTLQELSLNAEDIKVQYGSSFRGWEGDVPVILLDSTKLRSLGWRSTLTSYQAIESSLKAIHEELDHFRI
jgi:UDP-glucose 4-epimerase